MKLRGNHKDPCLEVKKCFYRRRKYSVIGCHCINTSKSRQGRQPAFAIICGTSCVLGFFLNNIKFALAWMGKRDGEKGWHIKGERADLIFTRNILEERRREDLRELGKGKKRQPLVLETSCVTHSALKQELQCLFPIYIKYRPVLNSFWIPHSRALQGGNCFG